MHDISISRYVIALIINIPIILVGIIGALTSYKTSKISKKRFFVEFIFWILVSIAIVCIEPVYNILIKSNLTNSTPMSLFDIVLLTMILFSLLLIGKAYEKIDLLNKKFSLLHEHIVMSDAHAPLKASAKRKRP